MTVLQVLGIRNDFCGGKSRKRGGNAHGYTFPNHLRRPEVVLEEKRSLAGERAVTKGKFPNFPTSGYARSTFYFVLKATGSPVKLYGFNTHSNIH